MSNMSEKEVDLMRNSGSEQEWEKNCDIVKANHGGQYPEDWYARIVLSRAMRDTTAKWGGTDQITIEGVK